MKARKINGIIESYSTKPESIISIITGQIQPTWKYASEEEEFAEGFETVIEPILTENQYYGSIIQSEDEKFEFDVLYKQIPKPKTQEELFDSKQAIDTLFPYFQNEMYDKDGAVSLIMNLIQYGGAFRAIAMKVDYMHTTNQINDAGYQYFLQVFNEQNIDLLNYIN